MIMSYVLVAPNFMRFFSDWDDLYANLLVNLQVGPPELNEIIRRFTLGEDVQLSTKEGISWIVSGVVT